MKTERLEFLADINRYTQRYAEWIGRQCREKSIKAVAEETNLGWDSVKDLDKLYMAKQLEAHPIEPPKRIGIDELAIGRGHSYRILIHDLDRKRPIWFGDDRGRSREAIDAYFQSLSDSVQNSAESDRLISAQSDRSVSAESDRSISPESDRFRYGPVRLTQSA